MLVLTSTVTQKGQVTIPKATRDSLHLMIGDKVEFVRNEQVDAVIKPLSRKVAGMLSQYKKSQPVSIEVMDQAIAGQIAAYADYETTLTFDKKAVKSAHFM